jgi:hypothetical protein
MHEKYPNDRRFMLGSERRQKQVYENIQDRGQREIDFRLIRRDCGLTEVSCSLPDRASRALGLARTSHAPKPHDQMVQVPTCRPPSATYAGSPLDFLRARRTKNASRIAPIVKGLSNHRLPTKAHRRGR